MNYQSYDDYMRSILGYNNMNSNMCMNNAVPYQDMYIDFDYL